MTDEFFKGEVVMKLYDAETGKFSGAYRCIGDTELKFCFNSNWIESIYTLLDMRQWEEPTCRYRLEYITSVEFYLESSNSL